LKADTSFDFVADVILVCSLYRNREMNVSTAIVSMLESILEIVGIG